jgi:hypothetical protein
MGLAAALMSLGLFLTVLVWGGLSCLFRSLYFGP